MGKTILCPHCKSTFDESILAKRSDPSICPICENSLLGDDEETIIDEELSFGEGIELSENDSFDEDKIDFWWYSIREPGTLDKSDTGDTGITCTTCGNLSGTSYPIARTGKYLLLHPRGYAKCSVCKKELKNHILSKRPEDWIDPRKRDIPEKDRDNIPKCPICSSTKIHKISMTNKAASALAFGLLATGHVSKTYKCDICGAKF